MVNQQIKEIWPNNKTDVYSPDPRWRRRFSSEDSREVCVNKTTIYEPPENKQNDWLPAKTQISLLFILLVFMRRIILRCVKRKPKYHIPSFNTGTENTIQVSKFKRIGFEKKMADFDGVNP